MASTRFFFFSSCLVTVFTGIAVALTSTDTIFFRHYSGSTSTDINIRNITFLVPMLDLNETTMFYIHGYNENVENESVLTVTSASLEGTTDNVVAVDYSQIAKGNYVLLVDRVGEIGQVIADALNELVAFGLNPSKIHVVGHSFGGQVAGQIGRRTSFSLPRISGLDPAGPLFKTTNSLSASDANFVDIIHTDSGKYGQQLNSGTVNFCPNYGRRVQPGCPLITFPGSLEDFCSHHRSWRFYAESILNPNGFLSVQCNNDVKFALGLCNTSNIIPMGYATSPNATGLYYLTTNAQSPFAKGLEGTRSTS